MTTINGKISKKLNHKQIKVLEILYKFRFGTSQLIASFMNQSTTYTRTRLSRLLKQNYIARNYNNTYKLKGLPANYYLLPKAIKLLKSNDQLDQKGLHLLYDNKKASTKFINHCLEVFTIYLKLDQLYQRKLEFFSYTEIADQDRFPRPSLDSFLILNHQDYYLELLDNSITYTLLKRKVNKHLKHYEVGKLEGDYPTILLICSSQAIKTMITKYLNYILDKKSINELEILVTTKNALLNQKDNQQTIWNEITVESRLVSL